MYLNLKGHLMPLNKPIVMGIANYTTDSFFDGGKYMSENTFLKRIESLLSEGVDIIDLGAMSTRPGALELDEKTEIERIKEALNLILIHFPNTFISIDTWRSSVAEMAVNEGAAMINDISGGSFDEQMIPVIGRLKVPYCLMHTTGKPDIMQQNTQYESLIGDMLYFFGEQIGKLKAAGALDIIIDLGFGFGKTLEQNYFLMNNLNAFSTFGLPILTGISRKSMIYNLLNCSPQEALNGTTVLNTIALLKGTHILRVHDVREAKEAILITQMLADVTF